MPPFGRQRDLAWGDRADAADTLSDLWRRALSAGMHGANCGCGLGGFMLTGAELEADILDFLAARYPRDRDPQIADLLAARRSDSPMAFPHWLEDVEMGLDADLRMRLNGDVRGVLESIGGVAGGFVCT